MTSRTMRRSSVALASGVFAVAVLLPTLALAQEGVAQAVMVEAFDLGMQSSITPLNLPPGGFLRISGVTTLAQDGTSLDAAREISPRGQQEAGLIDPVASGLQAQERDLQSHTYSFGIGDISAASCQAAGLQPPCLVLRLPQLAAARRLDVDELREELSGALRVEIYQPAMSSYSPPPVYSPYPISSYRPPPPETPSYFWMGAAGMGGGVLLSIAFLALGLRRRRRSTGTSGRVEGAATRLRRKIGRDPVRARLLSVVNDLAAEAKNLRQLELRLAKAVTDAKPEELERRHKELLEQANRLAERGGEEAGQGEMHDAAKIVEGQLERCHRWERQQWRSAARLERIATRLEALEVELNDPALVASSPKQELLDVLQEELDLARAGEREAQELLGGRSEITSSRQVA